MNGVKTWIISLVLLSASFPIVVLGIIYETYWLIYLGVLIYPLVIAMFILDLKFSRKQQNPTKVD